MTQAAGYVLLLHRKRDQRNRDAFTEKCSDGEIYAKPVLEFKHSRSAPLVCFVSLRPGIFTHLCYGRRGVKAGTSERRLNFSDIQEFPVPLPISRIVTNVSTRFRKTVKKCLTDGGFLTSKRFSALIDAICKLEPTANPLLERYSAKRVNYIRDFSRNTNRSLAFQKDAVTTALDICGISRDELRGWTPFRNNHTSQKSFLDGLTQVRNIEDQMIMNDLMKLPGFDRIKERLERSAVRFEKNGIVLTIVTASRTSLEKQFGTDLIYYNETFKSFVMVQYKAMDLDASGKKAGFSLPNLQLEKEILRMDNILSKLSCPNGVSYSSDDFRLMENPFFLKLCERIIFDPDDVKLIPGMYFPLMHWKLLENDTSIRGPRNGRRITRENAGRYMDDSVFVKLVSKSWVGTSAFQSTILEHIIEESIKSGKSIILAEKTVKLPGLD
jgi:hypothetical protein